MLSRERLIEALADGATMLDIAGGCLEVVVGRAPTDVPGEMVMTGALIMWKDRTDAKPQPEQESAVVPERSAYEEVDVRGEPIPKGQPEESFPDAIERERAEVASNDRPKSEPVAEPATDDPDNPDGFDYSKLAEEDIDTPVPAA